MHLFPPPSSPATFRGSAETNTGRIEAALSACFTERAVVASRRFEVSTSEFPTYAAELRPTAALWWLFGVWAVSFFLST